MSVGGCVRVYVRVCVRACARACVYMYVHVNIGLFARVCARVRALPLRIGETDQNLVTLFMCCCFARNKNKKQNKKLPSNAE